MNWTTFFLVLATGLANAQLNFEGNPLTENTDYTAEESRSSGTTATRETTVNLTAIVTQNSVQNFHPTLEYVKNSSQDVVIDDRPSSQGETTQAEQKRNPDTMQTVQTARQMSSSVYPADMALNTFLNSKTPEESRLSLDHYLQSRQTPRNVVTREETAERAIADHQQLTQQLAPRVNQQSAIVSTPVNQQLTMQLMQQRQTQQAVPVNQQQSFNEPIRYTPTNVQDLRSPFTNTMGTTLMQQQQVPQPYVTGLQARNDLLYPGWYNRMRRVRGKPFPYAQTRVGSGFYGGPSSVPFKQKGPPVEVIYTKPPGFHRGPPPLSNPPVPYEDASAWFPEVDHPPSTKDVYYSQLYAQSYDPHYYNYIAKTGKIKPHLYGKLGKYHEEENDGIWAELYRGFKKHGLKNIMTPTFLLGMTLPVVTLMLSALVQKRSLSRSDSRELSNEDAIQEYLEQIEKAIECYEKRRRKREAYVDGC